MVLRSAALRAAVELRYNCVLHRRRGGERVKKLPGLRNSFDMSRISARGDTTLYDTTVHKQTGLCVPRTTEFRVIIMNENSTVVLIVDTVNKQTYIIKRTEMLFNIPTGRGLTSWLFTKHGGVEFGTTEDNSI